MPPLRGEFGWSAMQIVALISLVLAIGFSLAVGFVLAGGWECLMVIWGAVGSRVVNTLGFSPAAVEAGLVAGRNTSTGSAGQLAPQQVRQASWHMHGKALQVAPAHCNSRWCDQIKPGPHVTCRMCSADCLSAAPEQLPTGSVDPPASMKPIHTSVTSWREGHPPPFFGAAITMCHPPFPSRSRPPPPLRRPAFHLPHRQPPPGTLRPRTPRVHHRRHPRR